MAHLRIARNGALVASLVASLIDPRSANAAEPETLAPAIVPDPAIHGGDAASACAWPSAVYVNFGQGKPFCSGTLVHPDIVITAAHCPEDKKGRSATIHFGEAFETSPRSVKATCYAGASWNGLEDINEFVGADDYGYCKLEASVTDVPIIPPAYGCDVDELIAGKEVHIVGFGEDNEGDLRTKRAVATTINEITDQANIGGDGRSSCTGDSGGPVFARMSDGSWRSFGITSGGEGITQPNDCEGYGIYALMHVAIPWIEEHSGVDITPCHDVDGTWNPTPACVAIPSDPAKTHDAVWDKGCSGGPTMFSELCGAAFVPTDDAEPPSVSIINPSDDAVYDLAPADVPVSVTADDGDGHGVASVTLLVDGEGFPGNTDGAAPYEWPMIFPKGAYTLTALAVDFEGNEALSAPVSIYIEQEPPADETDGATAGSSSGGGEESGEASGGAGGFDPIDGCSCSSHSRVGSARGLIPALFAAFGLLALRRRRD